MHKLIMTLALLAALTAACAAPAAQVPTAAPQSSGINAAGEIVAPGRSGLRATDPATVSLAAGKPQLVEFFAFW